MSNTIVDNLVRGTNGINSIEEELITQGVISSGEQVPIENFPARIRMISGGGAQESIDKRLEIDNIRTLLVGHPSGLVSPEANDYIYVSGIKKSGDYYYWDNGTLFVGTVTSDTDAQYSLRYNKPAISGSPTLAYLYISIDFDVSPMLSVLELASGFEDLEGLIIDCKGFVEKPNLNIAENQLTNIKFMDATLDWFNKRDQTFNIFVNSSNSNFGQNIEYINPAFVYSNTQYDFTDNETLINFSSTNLYDGDSTVGIASAPNLKRYIYSGTRSKELIVSGENIEYIKGKFSMVDLSRIHPSNNVLKLKRLFISYTDSDFTLILPDSTIDCSGLIIFAADSALRSYWSELDARSIRYVNPLDAAYVNSILDLGL